MSKEINVKGVSKFFKNINILFKAKSESLSEKLKFKNIYKVECFRPDGSVRWTEEIQNLVVDVGLDDVLDKYFKGSAYTASFFVGLTDGTPTVAAGDTMASHVGWVEVQNYTEGTREALTLGTVSGKSVDNSASKASFSVNATVTIGGAFITTNSTKGGATGILYGAVAFAADRSALSGDTINVTATLTSASA